MGATPGGHATDASASGMGPVQTLQRHSALQDLQWVYKDPVFPPLLAGGKGHHQRPLISYAVQNEVTGGKGGISISLLKSVLFKQWLMMICSPAEVIQHKLSLIATGSGSLIDIHEVTRRLHNQRQLKSLTKEYIGFLTAIPSIIIISYRIYSINLEFILFKKSTYENKAHSTFPSTCSVLAAPGIPPRRPATPWKSSSRLTDEASLNLHVTPKDRPTISPRHDMNISTKELIFLFHDFEASSNSCPHCILVTLSRPWSSPITWRSASNTMKM